MKRPSFSIARPILVGAICGGVLLACVPIVAAQAPRSISNVGRRLDDFNKQGQKADRDEMEREMSGRKPTPEERREAEIKKAHIKEDLATLQSSYNDIVVKLQSREKFGEEYVAAMTERISKTGSRLLHDIHLPAVKPAPAKSDNPTTPPAISLKALCVEIYAFLTSPVFETGVLDIKESAKARETLERVIYISDSLRHKSN